MSSSESTLPEIRDGGAGIDWPAPYDPTREIQIVRRIDALELEVERLRDELRAIWKAADEQS